MVEEQAEQPQLFMVTNRMVGAGGSRVVKLPSSRPRNLRVSDLCRWSQEQLAWIAAERRQSITEEVFLYQQAAKLVEEVGELHAELLGRSQAQRVEKGVFTKESLAEECADVAITLAILSEVLGVDLPAALTRKMRKVDERRQTATNRRSVL